MGETRSSRVSSGEPIDPKRGNVRLRVVPDEICSLEDLEGDCFNPKANPDIPASRLKRDREEFIAKVNREGVWGIIGEYFDGEVWQHADSCFGFVGDDWKHSGYDTDIMRATLDAARDARVCRCCGRPILKKPMLGSIDRPSDLTGQFWSKPQITRQKGSNHEDPRLHSTTEKALRAVATDAQ